jgi:hypothetical protein
MGRSIRPPSETNQPIVRADTFATALSFQKTQEHIGCEPNGAPHDGGSRSEARTKTGISIRGVEAEAIGPLHDGSGHVP